MSYLKLNTILISSVALLGAGSAVANSHTEGKAVMKAAASMAAPLVKRSILFSLGNVSPSTGDIKTNLEKDGYSKTQVADTSDAKTFAIGYRQPLGRHWSVDVTFIDQGEISANVEAAPSGSTNPAKDVALSLPIYGSGLNYAGLRHFRVSNGVTAHAGAGAFIYTNERKATVDGKSYTKTDSGVKPMAQLGLSFAVTPRVNVELTGQRFFMDGDDVDRVSLGVSVGF